MNESIAQMRRALLDGRRGDGGWGYYGGQTSRIESTCWAALALDGASNTRAFFDSLPRDGGLLTEPIGPGRPTVTPANIAFNGLAALVFANRPDLIASDRRATQLQVLVDDRGVTGRRSPVLKDDPTLSAWPWVAGTASWVEPTSWCRLALRRTRSDPQAVARTEDAVRLLGNRVCAGGGWNYGNSQVFGDNLRPHLPTTALALLALQDRRDVPFVASSLAYLRRDRLSQVSGLALALVTISLTLLGEDAADVRDALVAQWRRTWFFGNLHVTAMALYALTADHHGLDAFRI